jgi:hypothetical protein
MPNPERDAFELEAMLNTWEDDPLGDWIDDPLIEEAKTRLRRDLEPYASKLGQPIAWETIVSFIEDFDGILEGYFAQGYAKHLRLILEEESAAGVDFPLTSLLFLHHRFVQLEIGDIRRYVNVSKPLFKNETRRQLRIREEFRNEYRVKAAARISNWFTGGHVDHLSQAVMGLHARVPSYLGHEAYLLNKRIDEWLSGSLPFVLKAIDYGGDPFKANDLLEEPPQAETFERWTTTGYSIIDESRTIERIISAREGTRRNPGPSDNFKLPANLQGLTLHPRDRWILMVLREAGTCLTQEKIEGILERDSKRRLSAKTIGKRLERLRNAGFTTRPNGDKGGDAITPEGRTALDETSEEEDQAS